VKKKDRLSQPSFLLGANGSRNNNSFLWEKVGKSGANESAN
jgi:hypothetical protein